MVNIVVTYTRNYGGGSNNEVEPLVLLWGLRIVRAWGANKIYIEVDSMLIINASRGVGANSQLKL